MSGPEAAVVAAIVIAGTAVSTYAAVRQSEIAKDAADAQKKAGEEEARFEEQQHRRRVLLALGKQRAVFAAAGVDPLTGTPLEQEIDLVKQAELQTLTIRNRGRLNASMRQLEIENAEQAKIGAIGSGVASVAATGAQSYFRNKPSSVTTDWGSRPD